MAFSQGVGGLLCVVVAAAVETDRGMLPPSIGVENGATPRPHAAIVPPAHAAPPWLTFAGAISPCAATG
jgi:hypothetical protein